jgi:hypothetical protein
MTKQPQAKPTSKLLLTQEQISLKKFKFIVDKKPIVSKKDRELIIEMLKGQ